MHPIRPVDAGAHRGTAGRPPVTVDLFRAENVIIQDGLLRDTT